MSEYEFEFSQDDCTLHVRGKVDWDDESVAELSVWFEGEIDVTKACSKEQIEKLKKAFLDAAYEDEQDGPCMFTAAKRQAEYAMTEDA